MPFVVVKQEKKLRELVSRVYGELPAAQAKRAEAAMLRANPQLADAAEIATGTLVIMPAVPGLRRVGG